MGKTMGKAAVDFFTKALDTPASLIILLGFLILAFGLSGGIEYKDVKIVESGVSQIIGITFGIVVFVIGIVLVILKPYSPRPYGITIRSPVRDQEVSGRIRVEGKIRRPPPAKYQLWLFRIYNRGEFLPMRQVNLAKGEEDWSVADFVVGGPGGGYREIGAFLVCPAGQPLFTYFWLAADRHNRWMDQFKVDRNERDRYLPNLNLNITEKVEMIDCHRVSVKLKDI